MRRLMLAFIAAALALGGMGSAGALTIDSFSAGLFNLNGPPGSGAAGTFACGATCLGGQRDVFVIASGGVIDAFVQLSPPPGEAQSVMPPAGGRLQFTYRAPAVGIDLTLGGSATSIDVHATVFATGGRLLMEIEDTSGASQTVVKTPPGPGIVSYLPSEFSSVNLAAVVRVAVSVESPGVGDYHISEILVPDPNTSGGTQSVNFAPGNPTTRGGPGAYPSFPPITFEGVVDFVPLVAVGLVLEDVREGARSLDASITAQPPDPHRSDEIFLVKDIDTQPSGPIVISHRFDFSTAVGIKQFPIGIADVSQKVNPGGRSFEVMVDLLTDTGRPGRYSQTFFVEVPPSQAGSITGVTAGEGSLMVDVMMTGVDANQPVLNAVTSASFTPSPGIPALGGLGMVVLAGLLAAAGGALVLARTRMRTG